MTVRMSKTIFLLTLLLLVQNGSSIAQTLRERFEKSYPLAKGGELILENTNGSVRVQSWDRDEVKIEGEKVVKANSRRDAEKAMERLRIDIEHGETYLKIDTKMPNQKDGFWVRIFGDQVNASVNYHLFVPTELDLNVNTVNGRVDVEEVGGQVSVKTVNGKIIIERAMGVVKAKTTNGGIEAELLAMTRDEDMDFKTTNGGIRVTFPQDLHADVYARTSNGSIRTDFPIEVNGRFSKRKLEGTINGGGGRIELKTTNGSIRILQQ